MTGSADALIESGEDRDALLRVAVMIATGVGRDEVLAAVATAASTLLNGAATTLIRFDPGNSYTVVASCAAPQPVGTRVFLGAGDQDVLAEIFRTGKPARPDVRLAARSESTATGDMAGMSSSLGVPITVDNHLWGALAVTTGEKQLPRVTDRRLQPFAELVAGAVHYSRIRAELLTAADERAALRRIHAVAGRGGTGAEVMAAIAAEASAWLGDTPVLLLRRNDDGTLAVVASSGGVPAAGAADRVADDDLIAQVLRSGRSVRVDEGSATTDRDPAREPGPRATIGVPVVVKGQIWGLVVAGSSVGTRAPDAPDRLTRFTESVTPTILSAQARAQLAQEQFALRRVAELVAGGAGGDDVFATVVREASALAHGAATTLSRWDVPDRLRIIAAHGVGARAVGTQVSVDRRRLAGWLARAPGTQPADDRPDGSPVAELGPPGSVVVPVELAGTLWGVLGASSAAGPLPAATEHRLHQFADLVAASLASAQARAEIQSLADQQAALRRIAELAARDAPAERVLAAVASEASGLVGVEFTTLLRYEADGSAEIVALSGAPDGIVLGALAPREGDGALQRVWRTGRSARIENLATTSGHGPQVAKQFGFTTSVAVPVTMQGRLWGAIVAVGKLHVPASIEEQLAGFAELAGTAVSAAQARRDLRVLADEQSAFRRVAELVAHGATLDEVFTAAAAEASALVGQLATALVQYVENDDFAVMVATCNSTVPRGLRVRRVPIDEESVLGTLRRTGRTVRVETFGGTALAEAAVELGVTSGVAVPVTVEGRVWGVLTASTSGPPLPAGTEERLTPIAELAAAAIANAENRAKLTASRARVVATADETRRRLQRDVHDGAQQRLVHTIIALKLAGDALAAGQSASGLLQEALDNAERANKELRDIVRGILPASLTHGGLNGGLESLVADLALPVDLRVTAPRLPAHVETTAYFVVAEALTNVVKHARASRAAVDARLDNRTLIVEIRDDGVGGADPATGTGLTGLFDRVEASDGTLTVTSVSGAGTTIRAAFPVREPLSTAQP